MKIFIVFIILACSCLIFHSFNINTSYVWDEEISIDSISYRMAQQQYDLYLEGVKAQSSGNIENAKQYFQQYLTQEFKHEILNNIEIDLLARYMGIAGSENNWGKICNLGERLEHINQQTRKNYKNTGWMYLMYVFSLNMLNRCENIEVIIQKGLHYVDRTYKPTEKEYYELRFQHIVSKLNKNEINKAFYLLNEIKEINDSAGRHIADASIHLIERHISKYAKETLFYDKKKFIDEFSDDVVKTSLWTRTYGLTKVKILWNSLINLAQAFLGNTYFDANSIEDEEYWTKFMVWYNILVNGFGKGYNISDRGSYAYNYVLTSKNFLDWHSKIGNKKNITWQQILHKMGHDEVAVEFIQNSNEAIILSHKFNNPQIVAIDSLIMDRILKYNNKDPLIINSFYKSNSPLIDLIHLIEPYIRDCKKIYISGSNHLSQFNYGAIPYKGKKLDDTFEIIPMISTADIIPYKGTNQEKPFQKVILYGGIEYENSLVKGINSAELKSNWAYLSEVPEQLRNGYDFLPYSKTEVDSIATLCDKYNISSYKCSGKNATETTLKDIKLSSKTILHIATHSFLLPSYSFNSLKEISKENQISRLGTILSNTGLLFSGCNRSLKNKTFEGDDGILTAKEISHANLSNVGLVVLSSCSSGLGDIDNVNGIVYGLTNAFKSAGCNQIMISLWDVPDYTTSQFMVAFYKTLLQGNSTRESLRHAQAHLISLGYEDPYYWGAFVILE